MKVSLQDASPCRKVMAVDVGYAAVLEEYQKVLGEFSAGARLRGFRPGKAPVRLVERQYAKDILEEIKDRMIPKCYREALHEQKLVPVAVVSVENVKLALETGMQFTVTLDVAPDFDLPEYLGIPIKREVIVVTDKDVDEAVDSIRRNHATYEESSDREIAKGDLVNMDYEGTVDGSPLSGIPGLPEGLGSAKDFWAMVGDREILPGVSEKLLGHRIGDDVELDVPFPETAPTKELAGKTGHYRITIKQTRKAKLPELDETFVKMMGCASVDEIRQRVRENIEGMRKQEERRKLKDGIVSYLLSKASFDLPKSVLEEETSMAVQSMVQRSIQQGASREVIREKGTEILDAASKSSMARTRLMYILSRIASVEKVDVTEEEIAEEIEGIAQRQSMTPAKARALLEKRHAMDRLHTDIRCEKVLDLLLEKAAITD